ncbi:MAG TPA: DUF4349 domain-containing protein [Polyangiaceae bacterium]|nr:DUF4349 domain-containing protein [Polyangiaceae bacterium]
MRLSNSRLARARRASTWVFAVLLVISLPACARSREAPSAGATAKAPSAAGAAKADGTQPNLLTTARKIIRSAELSLEVESPARAQSELTTIVERLGGYVASSERELGGDEGERDGSRVNLVVRVPSDKLGTALTRLEQLGRGAMNERLSSEDVTDEVIDLDARIANQKRLEAQLGTLLSQANTVEAALRVHKELAAVRTEIDRMAGRRQFLEKETDFAKISLTLSALRPVVGVSLAEFGVSLRRAAADSVAVAAAVLFGGLRLLGVLLPLAVLLGLPAWGLMRLLRRRGARRQRMAAAELG